MGEQRVVIINSCRLLTITLTQRVTLFNPARRGVRGVTTGLAETTYEKPVITGIIEI